MMRLRRRGQEGALEDLGEIALLPVEAGVVQHQPGTRRDVPGGDQVFGGEGAAVGAGYQGEQPDRPVSAGQRDHSNRFGRQSPHQVAHRPGLHHLLASDSSVLGQQLQLPGAHGLDEQGVVAQGTQPALCVGVHSVPQLWIVVPGGDVAQRASVYAGLLVVDEGDDAPVGEAGDHELA
jgi:hypothetical protein